MRIVNAGLAGIVVDSGRPGLQHQGITVGGPLDENAYFWANGLVRNTPDSNAAVLELRGECEFEITETTQCCVTGPNVLVELNGNALPAWHAFEVKTGDSLKVASTKGIDVFYLAVHSGFDVPLTLGSTSTTVRENLGGLDTHGGILKQDDVLPLKAQYTRINPLSIEPPKYNMDAAVRVILGYQVHEFPRTTVLKFFNQSFKISANSNRMGFRLEGKPLDTIDRTFLSEGVHLGAIQVPPSGEPIVMLADRQTLGGYPKIGAIALIDLHRFAHFQAGEQVQFEEIDVYTARNLWRQKCHARLSTLESML